MNNLQLKSAAKAAVAHVMAPLARLMLNVGVSAIEFAEIARLEFVRAAVAEGASSTPPATSDSHISVVTGLSRRDVEPLLVRLREQAATEDAGTEVGQHRAERVLNAWCQDPEFQEAGEPARLFIRGGKSSFSALVRKHSPDPRPRTILHELERVRAVRRDPDGTVQVIRRTYAPQTLSPDGLKNVAQQGRDHLETLIHNLHHPNRPLYQRRVVNGNLTQNQAAILMRYIALQADAVMDTVDSSLNDPPVDRSVVSKGDREGTVRLGVGFHLIREPIEEELDLPTATASPLPSRKSKRGHRKVTRQRRSTKD
jgi:Family of unknown function (DUF6502)